jgi:hypothetical protein
MQGLQFDTAKTEAVIFTPRKRYRKHLRHKLTPKRRVRHESIQFNTNATHWLAVWMNADLTFKEHNNGCMKKPEELQPGSESRQRHTVLFLRA